jgi:hypothetical protein
MMEYRIDELNDCQIQIAASSLITSQTDIVEGAFENEVKDRSGDAGDETGV